MRKARSESAEEWRARNAATLGSIFHLLYHDSYMFRELVTKQGEKVRVKGDGYIRDSTGSYFSPTHLYPLATLKDGRRLVWLCGSSSSVIAAIPALAAKPSSWSDGEGLELGKGLDKGAIEPIDINNPPELRERAIEVLHRLVGAVASWSEGARKEYELSLKASGALEGVRVEHDQDWYELGHPARF